MDVIGGHMTRSLPSVYHWLKYGSLHPSDDSHKQPSRYFQYLHVLI